MRKHFLRPGKCLDTIDINYQGDVICSECGRNLGFVYCISPLRVFIYEKYIRHRVKIIAALHNLVKYPDVISRIDPSFLEANEATIRNTTGYLSSAFDSNLICVEKEVKKTECE